MHQAAGAKSEKALLILYLEDKPTLQKIYTCIVRHSLFYGPSFILLKAQFLAITGTEEET